VDDVRAVGRRILSSTPTLTTIGPTKPLPSLEKIKGRIGLPQAA
jgi:hypothetical protein